MKMWKTMLFLFLTLQLNSSHASLLGQLSQTINDMVKQSMGLGLHFKNWGEELGSSMQTQFSGVNNLGNIIQSQVNSYLSPVFAMDIRQKLMNGVGGVTTVSYDGKNPRNFIIQNGVRSICIGTLQGRQCIGSLEPYTVHSNEDYCYANSYVAVNDQICLSFGGIHVQSHVTPLICVATDHHPVLQLTRYEYQELCGTNNRALYTYYANPNEPFAVPIPNSNPHIQCLNRDPGVCRFEVTQISHPSNNGGNGYNYEYRYRYK